MSIELRRHHAERLKSKRKAYYRGNASQSQRMIGMALHTPALCSCPMCGNPRKHFKELTIQERRMETLA